MSITTTNVAIDATLYVCKYKETAMFKKIENYYTP